MSHALGAVRFNDGKILFYAYSGTVDCCVSKLFNTSEESTDNWELHEKADCTCGNEEEIEIYADYGRGLYWKGRACRYCMAITDRLRPHGIIKRPFEDEMEEYNTYHNPLPPYYNLGMNEPYYSNKTGKPEWYEEMMTVVKNEA